MNKYEILYILSNELTDDNKQKLIDKFVQVVEQRNGVIVNLDKWGTRKFAYEIDHKNEGYYFLMNIEADPTLPLEIERQVSITDGVIRCMVIKRDEFQLKKIKRAEKPEFKAVKSDEEEAKVVKTEEELNYGAPVKDGIDPEFGIVTDGDGKPDVLGE